MKFYTSKLRLAPKCKFCEGFLSFERSMVEEMALKSEDTNWVSCTYHAEPEVGCRNLRDHT